MAYTDANGVLYSDPGEFANMSFVMNPIEDQAQNSNSTGPANTITVNGVVYTDTNEAARAIEAAGNTRANVTVNGRPASIELINGQNAAAGILVNGQPINYLLNGSYAPGQEEAMASRFGGSGTSSGTTSGSRAGDPNYDFFNSIYGLSDIPQIQDITLGENPQINPNFSTDTTDWWQALQNNTGNDIGNYYNWDVPQMNAATMDPSQVPGTTAATPDSFDALDFLLSGKGYDDPTLARMNAGALDSVSREAASQRGAAKIAAEQAGLTGSGADLATQGQINRRAGDARTQAENQIAIANAQQGMQNRITGSGLELQRETSAAEMQNQAALEKAAKEFAAMTQNVQNQQQANLTNTNNEYTKDMTASGKQADYKSSTAADLGRAMLTKAADAETQNTTNTINRNLNNAQLQRQKQMFNTGIGEGRYSQALGSMVSLAGGANPAAYNFNYQYQPNLIGAQSFSNLANGFLNNNRQAA